MPQGHLIKLSSENDSSTLDRFIRKHPYYTTVRLIINSSKQFTPKPYLREVSTTNDLMGLMRQKKNAYRSYVEAIPLDQVDLNPTFQNKLQFNGYTGEAIIHLDQPSYQKLPNLQKDQRGGHYISPHNTVKYAKVKKLSNGKVGHGKNSYSRYRYKISIKFTQPQLEFIIKTLFNNVQAESYIYDHDLDLPVPQFHQDVINLPTSLIEPRDGFSEAFKEMITLVANFNPQQITDWQEVETVIQKQYTMHNVYCESITSAKWDALLLETKDSHAVILREEIGALVSEEKNESD